MSMMCGADRAHLDARHSPSKNPAVAPTSCDHSQRRTHAAQHTVDRVPCNLKRVVFESSQERFIPGHDSDDDDFMPIPNTRSSSHIDKFKDVGPRKTRQIQAGLSTDACTEQYVAIEADGFGHLLRMKIDAVENKNLLTWLLDHTDPDRMLIRIGAGKVLSITPQIISMVLGLPIRGENFKQYSWKEAFLPPNNVYYLDNIDHSVSLVDRTSTPRLTFYDNALIDHLTVADTTITTQVAHTFGVHPFKPWSTTCYAADVRGAPCHNINVPAAGIPNLDIPRLLDLLFEPLDDLTGSHRERVWGFFSEFDHTLSQNKRSIENSIANIVRAQFQLADQCRPIIHELVASQTWDTNIPGDTSRTMHTRNDHGTRESAHCPSSFNPTSPTGPFGSPVHCVVSPPHIYEDLPRPSTTPMRTSSKDVSGSFIVTNDPTVHPNSPVHTPIMAPTELVQNDPPLHRGRIIHPQGFFYTETIPTSSAFHHSRSEHNSPYAPELPEACSNKTIGKDTTSALK
ncbi:unnamed protein product [Miscanthus lutarioriparius]|uniref:Uncharacterized protein n=1 Tax=Miscanthus lutarioriparius TaxID=422564 RepID=A0A811R9Q7_9POAL|nr:unnamed protein product [Miscanthus lutarioriparius]